MIINKLKQVLDNKDKTAYWLAKQTKISPNTVFNIVNDEMVNFTFSTLNKFIEVLNCKVEDLIEYKKETPI